MLGTEAEVFANGRFVRLHIPTIDHHFAGRRWVKSRQKVPNKTS